MKKKMQFKPLLKSPYYQTVLANIIDFGKEPPSKPHYVKLSDGDVLYLEVSTPKGWTEDKGTIVLLHGLCGSSKSPYIKRIAKKVYNSGRQAVRINMRGCGLGRGLAKNIYHSGCSGDIKKALEDIKKHFPGTSIILIGFSLGANLTVKLAGELGKANSNLLKAAFAVSPPVNLLTSAHRLALPKNQVYAEYFSKQLFTHIDDLHKAFPDLAPHRITEKTSLNDIDELYIARRAKFSGALDYYKHCSSIAVVKDIKIPTKILLAMDDPIIDPYELDKIDIPENVEVIKTDHGGHIGYVGKNILREFRWMDNLIEKWIDKILKSK
ncbi:alpha/beta fold hydrolase [bacterium]|nr:alpha/beta fold hydrolase [bacterium]